MNEKSRSQSRTLGLIQLAILHLIGSRPTEAFGVAIANAASDHFGRDVTDPQIYVALKRLEAHGFVITTTENVRLPSKRSRGRPRKYYALTLKGRRAIEAAGNYIPSTKPFMNPRGKNEGKTSKGPKPTPVVA